MDVIFAVSVFVGVSMLFLRLIRKAEKQYRPYETDFCRDVRAKLGMFDYPSRVEARREKLNGKKSKF